MVARKDESKAEEWRPRSNETLLVARDTRFRGCRGRLTGFEERRASGKMVSRVFRGETGGRVWRENVLKDWHAIRFDRRPPAARAHETTRPSRRRRRSPRGATHRAISSLAIAAPSCHGIVENWSLLCPYHRPDEGYAVLSAEIVRIHGGSRTTAFRCFWNLQLQVQMFTKLQTIFVCPHLSTHHFFGRNIFFLQQTNGYGLFFIETYTCSCRTLYNKKLRNASQFRLGWSFSVVINAQRRLEIREQRNHYFRRIGNPNGALTRFFRLTASWKCLFYMEEWMEADYLTIIERD